MKVWKVFREDMTEVRPSPILVGIYATEDRAKEAIPAEAHIFSCNAWTLEDDDYWIVEEQVG